MELKVAIIEAGEKISTVNSMIYPVTYDDLKTEVVYMITIHYAGDTVVCKSFYYHNWSDWFYDLAMLSQQVRV